MKLFQWSHILEAVIACAVAFMLAIIFIPYLKTGHFGDPGRRVPLGSHIVKDDVANTNAGDSVTCVGGIGYFGSDVLILNGETIKCGARK